MSFAKYRGEEKEPNTSTRHHQKVNALTVREISQDFAGSVRSVRLSHLHHGHRITSTVSIMIYEQSSPIRALSWIQSARRFPNQRLYLLPWTS